MAAGNGAWGCDPASSSGGCASPASAGTPTWAGSRRRSSPRSLGRLYGLDQPATEELLTELWDWYVGELNTEMADYFQHLRLRYRTAILSNAAAGGRREEERRYGFSAMADVLVYSYEVGIEKPDQRIYEITSERLGVRPSEGSS
jgi:FMN phosphatase YigB (HAD superfamily)